MHWTGDDLISSGQDGSEQRWKGDTVHLHREEEEEKEKHRKKVVGLFWRARTPLTVRDIIWERQDRTRQGRIGQGQGAGVRG